MKAHSIFKKVGSILAEINEQYQYLSESVENLNNIELELLSANADFLAEHVRVLKKINSSEATTAIPVNENRVEANAPSDEISAEIEDENISNVADVSINPTNEFVEEVSGSNDGDSQSDESQETVETTPISAEVHQEPVVNNFSQMSASTNQSTADLEVIEGKSTIEEEKKEEAETAESVKDEVEEKAELTEDSFATYFRPEVNPIDNPEPISIADVSERAVVNEVIIEEKTVSVDVPPVVEEQKKVLTLNEMISAQMNQRTDTPEESRKSVSDIKSIINLNDKLLFIKDLFNGYSLAYSEAIELINRFDSFDAADNFLKTNYSAKNNWSEKQATADKFYELLNRRFAK